MSIVTIRNRYGDVIRRSRVMPDGHEVVVLDLWGRLSRPQVAATLRTSERAVAVSGMAGVYCCRLLVVAPAASSPHVGS